MMLINRIALAFFLSKMTIFKSKKVILRTQQAAENILSMLTDLSVIFYSEIKGCEPRGRHLQRAVLFASRSSHPPASR